MAAERPSSPVAPLLLPVFRRFPVPTVAAPYLALAVLTATGATVPAVPHDLALYGGAWLLGFAHHDGHLRRMSGRLRYGLAAALAGPAAAWVLTHPGPRGFDLNDILFWVKTEPAFGAQAVYLEDRYEKRGLDPNKPDSWKPSMTELKASGVKILAPPIWVMLALNDRGEIVPSEYAKAAKAAGLDLIGWSLERDGPLHKGGGFYHSSVKAAIDRDGDTLTVLDVLAKQVGIRGMFSDWPATTTFYASCMGMK